MIRLLEMMRMSRKAVTEAEMGDAVERARDLLVDLRDIAERLERGACEGLTDLNDKMRWLNSLNRESAHVITALLVRQAMDDDKRELAAQLKAQISA